MLKRLLVTAARSAGRPAGQATQHAGTALCLRGAARSVARARGGASGWTFNPLGMLLLTGAAAAGSLALAQEACASPQERTFIMIKPDGVHRGLVADIIKRFEQKGYKLVGIRVLVPPRDLAEAHYAEHSERPFFPKLVSFLTSGAVVAMVWEGKEAIKTGRQMIGATNPLASAPGTIRGDYAVDVGRNIIHGSDSLESAQREIVLWFKPEDLANFDLVSKPWIYE